MRNIIKLSYRPEIDGLRAIAILSVLIYHSNLSIFEVQLSGGYLGVDIFFVISGYLISKMIFKELSLYSKFDYLYFLERRARRILPASFLMIATCFVPAYFLMLPQFFENFSLSAFSSVFFGSNIYFHYSGLLYGAESGLLKPLLHTWSLSIEEQFYIFFSLFIIFFFNIFKKFLNLIFIFVFCISIFFANWASDHHISFNFYMIFSRAWEFLVGIFIAYNEKNFRKIKIKPILNNLLIYTSFLIIFLSFLYFDQNTKHPSLMTLPVILATGLIILFFNNNYQYRFFLNNRFSIFFGKISYSLYIWHFPIFSFIRIYNNDFDDNITEINFLFILLAIIVSFFSYKYIEQPFRNNEKINLIKFSKILSYKFIFLIFLTSLVFFKKGFDQRLPENLILRSIDDRLLYLQESISCHKKFKQKDDFCRFNKGKPDKIFIIGDSQLETFVYRLKRHKYLQNFEIIQMTRPGCYYGRVNDYRKICTIKHHKKRENLINKYPGSIIVIGGSLSHYLKINSFDEKFFKNSIENFIKNDHKLIFINPLPNFGVNVRQVIAHKILTDKVYNNNTFPIVKMNKSKYYDANSEAIKFLTSFKNENINFLDVEKIFCDKFSINHCFANTENSLLFLDSNHLALEGNKMINEELSILIQKIKKSSR